MSRTCDVRIYRGGCEYCEGKCCDKCRVGCWNPARFKNPFYGKDGGSEKYWWRYMYNFAEWLCAECYDDMISCGRYWEDIYRDIMGDDFEEEPEFTKIMETL